MLIFALKFVRPACCRQTHVIDTKAKATEDLKQSVRRMLVDNLRKGANSNYEHPVPSSTWNEAAVANYLRRSGYDYTLSVFMAESKINPEIRGDDKNGQSANSQQHINKIMLQVWENLEQKYNVLLKQRVQEMEGELANQFRKVESILRKKINEEESNLKKLYGRKLDELEEKEREMTESFERRHQNVESGVENERREILRQIREIEIKRRELGKVEAQLADQIDIEMKELRETREHLTNYESELRRRELAVELNIREAEKKIRSDEQRKYLNKLKEFKSQEQALRNMLEQTKTNSSNSLSLQLKIQDMQMIIDKLKQENAQLMQHLSMSTDKLKQISESSLQYSKIENEKLFLEMDKLRVENVDLQNLLRRAESEIRQLNVELSATKATIPVDEIEKRKSLHATIDELNLRLKQQNEQWQMKLQDQQLVYEELRKHWQFENERTRHLTEEINKLKKKNIKHSILNGKRLSSSDHHQKRLVKSNSALSKRRSDEETSRGDSPPDFVKDAQVRLQELETEAKNFDMMLNNYRKKEMNISANLLRQSRPEEFQLNLHKNDEDVFEDSLQTVRQKSNHMLIDKQQQELVERTIKKTVDSPDEKAVAQQQVPVEPQIQKSAPVAAIDDWEKRLKAREEERRRRDEEFVQRQKEELERLQKQEDERSKQQKAPQSEAKETNEKKSDIDPIMQKYMDMVMEQKRAGNAPAPPQEETSKQPTAARIIETKDDDVEVASIERPSSSEFEW